MQPLASVALTTIGKMPRWSGVPERVPLEANVRPAGSVLAVENVVAPMVLLAVKFWPKALLTVPVVVAGLLNVMVWQVTVRLYVHPVSLHPLASVDLTVIGNVPVWVG